MIKIRITFTYTKEKLNFDTLTIFYDANFSEHMGDTSFDFTQIKTKLSITLQSVRPLLNTDFFLFLIEPLPPCAMTPVNVRMPDERVL